MKNHFRITLLVCALIAIGGVWGLSTQAQQNRDIIRKHDIEDLEGALKRIAHTTGTYPPADNLTWCGILSAPSSASVQTLLNTSLRSTEKYADSKKPFPNDPTFRNTDHDYVYRKTSPVSFELLSQLEADHSKSRALSNCGSAPTYDYSVVSTLRNPF